MASIILDYSKLSKGILILKNNELPYINEKYLYKLSKKYFLGLYFGSFQEHKKEISKTFCFTISASGLIRNFYNIPNINLQGWNFSSSLDLLKSFPEINPLYDVQAIAYNGYRKQLRHMIIFFKMYIENFPNSKARVLAISDPSHPLHDHNIGKFYQKVIPIEIREKLILHKVDCYSNRKFSQNEIRTALMESKINVIGSRDEGAPRMLPESLVLKRPVLLSDATKMASTNNINQKAFLKFKSSNEFLEKAVHLKKVSEKFDPSIIYPEFFIENSIINLGRNLEKICNIKKEVVIDYFYRNNLKCLNSHYLTGHTQIINFNPNLIDDVCTNEYDFILLANKLLENKISNISNKNIQKKLKVSIYKKLRLKLYFLKVRILFLINCPRSSKSEELDKKHFKKHSRLI